ncbi:MAG: amidase [Gemmatimonadaceae bacterium]|nr:amidase [Gemmatimonadaceae bacterium]MCW5826453.1 amidase [Gemmatimonadaceae bacterium]
MTSAFRVGLAVLVGLLGAPVAAVAQQSRFDVTEATIAGVHTELAAGRLSCRALVQAYLDRIAAYDKRGPALNAIQTLHPRALAIADSLDAVAGSGATRGPLHCVPVLVKDQVETKSMRTTYGSALFKDFVPQRDATIVTRLQDAGAIILAKTTMGEFAQRYVGSGSGIIRNAYDPRRNPSGSSGGSATGVAANFGLVGIGEDTGGSIRGPAAVSSLVGLRPTLQLVSRHGMMPASPTQDTMGPMTRTVADAAAVLDVIAGYDPKDPITAYTVGQVPSSYAHALSTDALRGARIGVLRIPRDTALTRTPARDSLLRADTALARRDSVTRENAAEFAKVRPLFEASIAQLRALGADIVDSLSVPRVQGAGGNDYETEAATDAYLAQHPNAPYKTLREIILAGEVNPWRARSLIGSIGRSVDEPGFGTMLRRREEFRVAMLQLMAEHRLDALIYATYDAAPMLIANDVLTNPRPNDRYSLGDNRGLSPTLGWPALTVPMGFTVDGLPAGLEFLGRPFTEAQLLGFGYAYEQATKHRRPSPVVPPLPGRSTRD